MKILNVSVSPRNGECWTFTVKQFFRKPINLDVLMGRGEPKIFREGKTLLQQTLRTSFLKALYKEQQKRMHLTRLLPGHGWLINQPPPKNRAAWHAI